MTDRADLVDRLDSVSETLDTPEPLFVFTTNDGDHVDKNGEPISPNENGRLPGLFVLPNSVTDGWVDHE